MYRVSATGQWNTTSTIQSLAQKLKFFSSSLSPRDIRIFELVILQRLDPLDRMKFKEIEKVFSHNEIMILNDILVDNNLTE